MSDIDGAGMAWHLRRLSTGETLASHGAQHLRTPVLPGSIAKVITALAALEQGLGDVRVACPIQLSVHGRTLDCVHPARAQPFGLEDALAHSCNTFFTRLAARLDRAAWQRLATRLGVPAASHGDAGSVRPELLAVGLEGPMAAADTWRRVVVRALTSDDVDVAHRRRLRDGLRLAVSEGSATAVHEDWTYTLAKTGTVVTGQGSQGLAVVLRPDDDLDLVVRVQGAAGRDAAAVAADVMARHDTRVPVVRIGVRDGQGGVQPVTFTLDAYVARVVAAEAMPDMSAVALEALAITARTFAVAHRGRHGTEGFDLCDTTHCQVLAREPWSAAAAAARETRTLVVATDGQVVPAFHSAACAGHLHDASAIWPDAGTSTPATRVRPEPHPHDVPTWQSDVTMDALTSALRGAGFRGDNLRAIDVVGAVSAGHPERVRLDGLVPTSATPDRFRTIVGRTLGWDILKSHDWTAVRTATGVRFAGRGKGHGVGLCLAGAQAMAVSLPGTRASDVIAAYFPERHVTSLADALRLRVSLASQGRAPHLQGQLLADLADLRRTLRLAAPRRIEVVEHPSIEAYQRATGRAWWTGGSTHVPDPTSARIDIPPLAVLDRAGDATVRLRHELVHALTADALRDAPLWVQEGLAAYLAGEIPRTSGVEEGACPSDEELAAPGGAETMRLVYARAGACVARVLEAGRSWRAAVP